MISLKKFIIFLISFLLLSSVTFASNEEKVVTIFLFDISYSLQEKNKTGSERFTKSLNVINLLLQGYDNTDIIGFRTVGAFTNLCSTKLFVPIKRGSYSKIKSTADFIQPIGMGTAIEYSLRQIIESDFLPYPRNIKKHLILITDGYENCGGDPCAYIKNIRKQRDDILIDVISVLDDDAYFNLYNCLAKTTGGDVYHYSDDISDIAYKLREIKKLKKEQQELKPDFQPIQIEKKPEKEKPIIKKSRFEKGLLFKHFLYKF